MTGPYELNAIKDRLTAIEGIQQDILDELRRLTGPASSSAEVLSPSFPAANQPELQASKPEEGDQAQPEPAETTAAPAETTAETTRETAGNTETVGQTRIGAAE